MSCPGVPSPEKGPRCLLPCLWVCGGASCLHDAPPLIGPGRLGRLLWVARRAANNNLPPAWPKPPQGGGGGGVCGRGLLWSVRFRFVYGCPCVRSLFRSERTDSLSPPTHAFFSPGGEKTQLQSRDPLFWEPGGSQAPGEGGWIPCAPSHGDGSTGVRGGSWSDSQLPPPRMCT